MKSPFPSKEQKKLKSLLADRENFYKAVKNDHRSNSLNPSKKTSSDRIAPDPFSTNDKAASLLIDSTPKRVNHTHEQKYSLTPLPHLPRNSSTKSLSKPAALFSPSTKLDARNSIPKQSPEQLHYKIEDTVRSGHFTPGAKNLSNIHHKPSPSFDPATPVVESETTPIPSDKPQAPTASQIYLGNRKKYLPGIFSQGFSNTPKSHNKPKEEIFNLNRIKEELKVRRRKVYASPQDIITLQKLKMIQEVNRDSLKPQLTREDDIKIAILKRKIAINSTFGMELKNKESLMEDRKAIYKNLLLEYHPDKKKHEKEIAEEIFNYLLINKQLFIEGS